MQKLMQSRLFRLLSEHSQNEDSTLQQLNKYYEDFALNILSRLQKETSPAELYYSLGFVRLKLAGICEQLFSEEKKKCLENSHKGYSYCRNRYANNGMAHNIRK